MSYLSLNLSSKANQSNLIVVSYLFVVGLIFNLVTFISFGVYDIITKPKSPEISTLNYQDNQETTILN